MEMTIESQHRHQRRRRSSSLAVFALAYMLFAMPTGAEHVAPNQRMDGLWLTEGYGRLVEFQGDSLATFEITALSCVSAGKAIRKTSSGIEGPVYEGEGEEVHILPAISPDTRWMHIDGSVSSIRIRRMASRPAVCSQRLADTPVNNYKVFWQTFEEQYPFFGLRKVDWLATDRKFRPEVNDTTGSEELFQIFRRMIDPLHDRHTALFATTVHEEFHGYRPSADPFKSRSAATISKIIETKYVRGGLRDFCNKQLQFGMLDNSIGYLRIHSFESYSDILTFDKQLSTLESALDTIFQNSVKWRALVIDVRINTGGSDVFGISIASRLATHEYLAYSKVASNDPNDPTHRTPAQLVLVRPARRPGFRGRVVLLTSSDSISAAETFTMALLDRQPHVTRLGQSTQGVFSDVLIRKLPNGWRFGLPNEIYLTKAGRAFDGTGVPPEIEVPVFSAVDLARQRDTALDRSLDILADKQPHR